MNLTFLCVKCKYPHHFESGDLQGQASVSFTCNGCGTPQEVELPFKKKSREDVNQAAARIVREATERD